MGNTAINRFGIGTPSYNTTFVNGDLSSGVLTVTHNLNKQYVSVTVIDENDNIILPDEVTFTGVSDCEIDLTTYGTISGTWKVVIIS